jgi:hypothetical protein
MRLMQCACPGVRWRVTVFWAQVTGTATLNFDRKLISRSTVSYSISIGRTQDILSVQVDPAL